MSSRHPRMSVQTLKVLAAILEAAPSEISGADVARTAGLRSGTLYPILMRFEALEWLASRWEAEDPHSLGRPRRRLYRLTGLGQARARAALQELQPLLRRLAWA